MSTPAPAPVNVSQNQLQQIADELKTIKSQTAPKQGKDGWDKLGVIAQIFSGTGIAVLGLFVTFWVGYGQQRAADRQQAFNYLNQINGTKNTADIASLVSMINVSLSAEEAVPIAMRYASGDQVPLVRQAALRALRKLGPKQLQGVVKKNEIPEADIATGLLGEPVKVKLRVSDVEGYGVLVLNNKALCKVSSREDSSWMNLTDKQLQAGANDVVFCVQGGASGYSGRMNISVGSYQHVTEVWEKKCPCKAPAFHVLAHLTVPGGVGEDGSVAKDSLVTSEVEEPTIYPASEASAVPESCSNAYKVAQTLLDCASPPGSPEPKGWLYSVWHSLAE